MMLGASNRKTTRQEMDGVGEMKKHDIYHVREELRQWKIIESWKLCVVLVVVAIIMWFLL